MPDQPAATPPSQPAPALPRQDQARALGDPSRHELYHYLAEAGRDVGVAELTDHLGIHHNAVRQHLAKLVAAGLVTAGREVSNRPGRPRLVYRARPLAAEVDGPYERLAAWLTEVVATGDTPGEVGRRVGARLAERERGTTGSPVEALTGVMEGLGFAPTVRRRDGRTEVVLGRCPYASAVLVDPATVCALHRGIAEGAAATIGGMEVDDLVAHDPRRAGCALSLGAERGS